MNTNEITYPRLIEAIYKNLADEELKYNVFEDAEFHYKYDKFHEKYIDPEYEKEYDKGVEMYEKLNELVFGLSEKSFKIGFQSALLLLRGGI